MKKKPFEIRLVFDSEHQAKLFVAWWLDGGGEQYLECNTEFDQSDDWSKHTPKWLKIEDIKDYD